jgi:hypothetical protein
VTRVEIVIDELVMRGLTPPQARAAAAALETRLGELAAEPARLGSREEASRRLSPVHAASPAGVGAAVAGVVWNGVTGNRTR